MLTDAELTAFLPHVKAQANAYCNATRSWNDFDDYVQEAMLAILIAEPSFNRKFGVKLKTYLDKRIRYSMVDYRRSLYGRKSSKKIVMIPMSQLDERAIPEPIECPAQRRIVDAMERADYVQRFLYDGVLNERERRVVVLVDLQELTHKSVGEMLGVSESRITQIRKSALKKMKTAMEERQ